MQLMLTSGQVVGESGDFSYRYISQSCCCLRGKSRLFAQCSMVKESIDFAMLVARYGFCWFFLQE